MKLLVIVLCLLSERYLMHSISFYRFSWFDTYCQRLIQWVQNSPYFTNPWVLFALIVIPPVLITAIVYLLLHNLLFGVVGLLLSIVLLYYCIGPQNPFYPLSEEESETEINQRVGHYFAQTNTQLFSVLFWYVVAGPLAALTYRIVAVSCGVSAVSDQAIKVTQWLEWIPARLTVLLFLLVGNFQRGFKLFLSFLLAKPQSNNQMLSECGIKAAQSNDSEEVSMPLAESLVEHAVIVLLVFIALFILVSWM